MDHLAGLSNIFAKRLATNKTVAFLFTLLIFFCLMKYFYEKPELTTQLYGEVIFLEHPVYKIGTLFEQDGLGLIVVQRRFTAKYVYWDKIDPWLANDIYLHPKFPQYFLEHATDKDYPIIPVRKLMWALRMKPIPKEFWEDYI